MSNDSGASDALASSREPEGSSPADLHLGHAWWTVFVLMILNTISLMDRYMLSLMIVEVRKDMGLNDFQISLFQGVAFVLFFSVAGVIIGRLVDSYPVKRILFVCVTLWSAAATMTGLARDFWTMVCARMMTGFGEGGGNPSAQTLIASLFSKSRVSMPMSLFTLSGALGIGISYVTGGFLIERFTAQSLPGLESLAPWRQVLIITAAPGLLLAFLAFTMLEKRTFAAKPPPLVESWRELWRFLVSERHLFTRLAIACSMNTIMAYSVFSWAPTYARRVLGLSPSQVGAEMGLITTAGALAAAATFGYIVDRNFARGKTDYVMRAYAFGALIAVPFCLVGFTIDHHFAFLAAVMAMQGFVSAALGPATAAIQIATPPELRGRMAAAMLVVVNGLGFAVGPTLVGALTEFAFVDPQQVGNSIAVAVLICGPISAWAAWSGRAAFAARFKA